MGIWKFIIRGSDLRVAASIMKIPIKEEFGSSFIVVKLRLQKIDVRMQTRSFEVIGIVIFEGKENQLLINIKMKTD